MIIFYALRKKCNEKYWPDHIPYTGGPLSQESKEAEAPLYEIDHAPEHTSCSVI